MTPSRDKKIILVDIFGPTIQGEGALIGRPTWFIRLGGCDYRCHNCDTDYAVDPRLMKRRNYERLPASDIATKFRAAAGATPVRLVTLSGGNPAMWPLGDLVALLQVWGFQVALETQGSIYDSWITDCEFITVSPKGPGMTTEDSLAHIQQFMKALHQSRHGRCLGMSGVAMKIPIIIPEDLDFANRVDAYCRMWGIPLYLQTGNVDIYPSWNARASEGRLELSQLRQRCLENTERLAEQVMTRYPALVDRPILPQLHTLIWGNAERK